MDENQEPVTNDAPEETKTEEVAERSTDTETAENTEQSTDADSKEGSEDLNSIKIEDSELPTMTMGTTVEGLDFSGPKPKQHLEKKHIILISVLAGVVVLSTILIIVAINIFLPHVQKICNNGRCIEAKVPMMMVPRETGSAGNYWAPLLSDEPAGTYIFMDDDCLLQDGITDKTSLKRLLKREGLLDKDAETMIDDQIEIIEFNGRYAIYSDYYEGVQSLTICTYDYHAQYGVMSNDAATFEMIRDSIKAL